MFEAIVLIQNREERRVLAGERLAFGGAHCALALPEGTPLLAQLELSDGQVFLDAPPASPLRVNGAPARGSRLLQAGDVLELPGASIECASADATLRLRVSHVGARTEGAARVAPEAPREREPDARAPRARTKKRARFLSAAGRALKKDARARDAWRRRAPLFITLFIALPFVGLALFTWFGVSVEISITPAPDTLRASASLPRLRLGARVLLLPGVHRLRAERAGYAPLEFEYRVSGASGQRIAAQFQPLPGVLEISSTPVAERFVEIDGARRAQKTPLRAELAGGRHRVRVLGGERYQDYETVVEVEDRGRVQQLAVRLQPNWAVLHLRSQPAGAQIFVDDEARGHTPATLQVLAGPHKLRFSLAGYRDAHVALRAEANGEATLPLVTLRAAPGSVRVVSTPAGARVSADGVDRGAAPLTLELDPGAHRLSFFAPGYARLSRAVNAVSGETQALSVRLEAQYGEVVFRVTPPDAQIEMEDAAPPRTARGEEVLRLLARPQRAVVSRAGYGAQTLTVTPRAGERSVVEVRLQTLAALREANRPRELKTHDGQALLLLRPGGKFQLGSSRREGARRANEVLHEVELTRPFYLGAREVSNAEYRSFVSAHDSGALVAYSLNADEQPVVNLNWEAAARYCNWLSAQQGLPLAYPPDAAGRPAPAPARNTGYRLPTEAEWVWAARYHGGKRAPAPRYDWGDALPPPPGAGNFADASALRVLANALRLYRDGFIVSAAVARARANPLGLRGLSGNVAEWMHDTYATPQPGALLRDPRGPANAAKDAPHVIRGASWRHFRATQLRSSFRDYGSSARDDLGFRIARDGD